MAPSGTRTSRVGFIDAARGTAMLFVFLSHFGWIYFYHHEAPNTAAAVQLIGQVASPTFMLISGLMLGFLYEYKPMSFSSLRIKLIDRGLFLLTVGHAIIYLAHVPLAGGWSEALWHSQITDAIGVAIILGPLLLPHWSYRTRIVVALLAYAGAWIAVLTWTPDAFWLRWVKHTLVGPGPLEVNVYDYNFPIVPWVSVYLLGSALGTVLARSMASGRAAVVGLLLRSAGAAGAAALLLKGVDALLLSGAPGIVAAMVSPYQKLPPAPFYLLVYGAAGLAILALAAVAEESEWAPGLLRYAGLLGRTSLFVFLAEELLYVGGLYLLALPYTPWWPLTFATTVAILSLMAQGWARVDGMRVFTVGFPRWAIAGSGRHHQRPP